ncbi:hypothetical protein [Cellulomonas cellasea]|uniref:Lipoprotein n=2 Tax=Cellulomonas cellasea TaxID=43670 RepID=A0A0A0BAS1_9CELL|nr:hypothetical protein [Cellulomonas cellasea]KGM03278.1 hypothetical protein Q760_07220 [Cellulomonas cellasea DSM 20118]GEA87433.1 hypothetical protein CCE01nite_13820 [Cellulomonas cellasea]
MGATVGALLLVLAGAVPGAQAAPTGPTVAASAALRPAAAAAPHAAAAVPGTVPSEARPAPVPRATGPGDTPTRRPVTRCSDISSEDGWVSRARVVGDLLVDSGICALSLVTVTGDVNVLPGADLFRMDDSSVKGDVRVADAHVYLLDSKIFGGVVVDSPDDPVEAYSVQVRRSLRGAARTLNMSSSTIEGAVNLRLGEGTSTFFYSRVGGWVNTRGGDVWAVKLDAGRGVTVTVARTLSLCGGSIALDATVRGVTGFVDLGGDAGVWGDEEPCAEPAPLGGSLVLDANPAERISVARLAVAGNLVCTGNARPDGLVVHPTVTVAGTRGGQCA